MHTLKSVKQLTVLMLNYNCRIVMECVSCEIFKVPIIQPFPCTLADARVQSLPLASEKSCVESMSSFVLFACVLITLVAFVTVQKRKIFYTVVKKAETVTFQITPTNRTHSPRGVGAQLLMLLFQVREHYCCVYLYMLCRLMYWRMLLIYTKQLPVSGLLTWVHDV